MAEMSPLRIGNRLRAGLCRGSGQKQCGQCEMDDAVSCNSFRYSLCHYGFLQVFHSSSAKTLEHLFF